MAAQHFKPKACAWCGTEFVPTAPRSTYCTPECIKAKNRERMRKYHATNKDSAHEYYTANKERILEKAREYRQANKERLHEHRRKYDKANRERIRERNRAWRNANKETANESTRRWRANNPDKVGAATARRAKAELEGNATPKLIEAKWEAGNKTCILCGEPINPTLKAPHNASRTIEHLTPIARGGRHDLDNIDFAHYGCNARKQDRTLEEYREWRERVA